MAELDALAKWIRQSVPVTLWHYTKSSAMMGIISSNRMWADDVLSMNDPEEFIHAQEIVKGVIRTARQQRGDEAFLEKMAGEMVEKFFSEGSLSVKALQVFVVSFTTLDDDLNQWDRYAEGTRGVSLGFDLSTLRPEIEADTFITFAPCVYEDGEKRMLAESTMNAFNRDMASLLTSAESEEWMRGRMQEWTLATGKDAMRNLDEFSVWNQQFFNEKVRIAAAECAGRLLRLCALCKQRGYRVEKEWRLVLPVHTSRVLTTTERKTRIKNGKSITYLETRLNFADIDRLPISKIMLGPNFEKTEQVVRVLQDGGFRVTPSKVHFRLASV